ncbi:MAG: UDP-N-acetylmuramoyl-L-alanyl-D-glutamate--2,6-diaminopimelate ligase [Bacteroidota bacterium]
MNLSRVLDGVPVIKMFQTMYGKMVVTHDVEVSGIQYDSRKVGRGDLFVAIKGVAVDGHKFIDNAVAKGANVVVLEDDAALPDSYFMHAGVAKVVVEDSRKALAMMSANFFDHPSHKLKLVGVTGTNGKTSTTHLIKSILEANGERVGLIGTIEYKIGDEVIPATHTTPESLELYRLLATMVQRSCTAAVIEVSSHSLALSRVYGLQFAAAAFTNLTQDHLDFHQTMLEYFKAKKILFDGLDANASVVTNADDSYGLKIVSDTKAKVLTYGIGSGEISATNVSLGLTGTKFTVNYQNSAQQVESTLIGRFNVQNILAAYAMGITLGVERNKIVEGIANLKAVPGRFQQFVSPDGWIAVVDYAHTHDAMESCLRAIHDILPREQRARIITVFGAGGNRDKTKRPTMGRVATDLSDITILTSDNPRFEDPTTIVEEIKSGTLPGKTVYVELERRKAIAMALQMARRGDVVLLAGKGHECYQVVGDKKVHLDDREEVESFIRKKR